MSHLRMKSVLAVLLCLVTASYAADVENPYKNAKVGDWAKYKNSVNAGGLKTEMETKQTVTSKTQTEVTVLAETTTQGRSFKSSFTIKLDEKVNLSEKMLGKQPVGAEVKELATGEEKLTVAGKTIDTKWVELETTIKGSDGVEAKSTAKIWTSTTVGTVVAKMEGDMGGKGQLSMELVDFGSAK